MIKIQPTEKYNVNTMKMLTSAFESAYLKAQAVLPKEAPDLFLLISSCFSYVVLGALCVLVALRETGIMSYVWFGITAVFGVLLVFTLYKYIKNYRLFLQDKGYMQKKDKKLQDFLALFGVDDFGESVPATELSKRVSSLLGKQSDNVFNNALREMASALNAKNNPSDLLCKSLTPMGDLFPVARKRFYFRQENQGYVFYDEDFANPAGEIACDHEDIVAFGLCSDYSQADSEIIKKAGKVRPDSGIIKISDGVSYYFFEFQSSDYDKMRKLLPNRKEL